MKKNEHKNVTLTFHDIHINIILLIVRHQPVKLSEPNDLGKFLRGGGILKKK